MHCWCPRYTQVAIIGLIYSIVARVFRRHTTRHACKIVRLDTRVLFIIAAVDRWCCGLANKVGSSPETNRSLSSHHQMHTIVGAHGIYTQEAVPSMILRHEMSCNWLDVYDNAACVCVCVCRACAVRVPCVCRVSMCPCVHVFVCK